jgi:apolipoprotein D and lipocalin family protein
LKNILIRIVAGLFAAVISGCASQSLSNIKPVSYVNLNQFMGNWYVIACIPTIIETDAYNAIESYELKQDGSINTTFIFREGRFNGPKKHYNPKGFVIENTGNAVWGMQFIWPFKSEYIIAYLDKNYTRTIIARNARDYVWIMARTPFINDSQYQELIKSVADLGYDVTKLRKMPQSATLVSAKETEYLAWRSD